MRLPKLLIATCTAIAMGTAAMSADLRFSTPTPANHIFTRLADKLAGELSTDGDTIKVFPSNQLGDVPTVLSMLQTGSAEFTIVPVGTLAQRDPAFFGWFLPYQFKSLAEAGAAAKTAPAKEMLARLSDQGLIGLGYVFPGQRHVISREPILTPEDVQGMRIRAYPNDIFRAWWAELGGAATALPNPEIMPSLVTGVIDAVDTDIDIVLGLGMYTQAPHLSLTNHMAFPGAVLVSRRWWDAQSAERQEQIRTAVSAAEDWAVADMIENEEKLLEELAAIDGAEVHKIDTTPFEAHAKAVTDQFIDADPLIAEFVEASKKAIAEMQ